MKIEELQIGNFVMLGDNIYKIDEISANGWIFISEIKTNMGLTTTDDIIKRIKPIPLTTEILEKNGFKKSVSPPGIHAKCYELNNKDEKYCLTIANYNKYKRLLLNVDSEDSECFNIKCDYVHELQQALKLCRIDKKIKL